MACLLIAEIAVFFLHACVRIFESLIPFGHSPGHAALGVDPFAHPITNRAAEPLLQHGGRRAEALDSDQLTDIVRIDAGIAEGDVPAIGMGDDRYRGEFLLVDQLRKIIDAGARGILAIG